MKIYFESMSERKNLDLIKLNNHSFITIFSISSKNKVNHENSIDFTIDFNTSVLIDIDNETIEVGVTDADGSTFTQTHGYSQYAGRFQGTDIKPILKQLEKKEKELKQYEYSE